MMTKFPGHVLPCLLFILDRIGQRPDVLNFDGDLVTTLQKDWWRSRKPHTLRCAREDDRTRQERRPLTQKADQGRDVPDHVRCRPILHRLAV